MSNVSIAGNSAGGDDVYLAHGGMSRGSVEDRLLASGKSKGSGSFLDTSDDHDEADEITALTSKSLDELGVLKEGSIQKWLNYYNSYQFRYFTVEPGLISYWKNKGDPNRTGQTCLNEQCKVRVCPGDDTGIEIQHPRGVWYLKFENGGEKGEWIEAIRRGKELFLANKKMSARRHSFGLDAANSSYHPHQLAGVSPHSGRSLQRRSSKGDSTPAASAEWRAVVQMPEEENTPLLALVEQCSRTRQGLNATMHDVRHAQQKLIKMAARLRDATFREDAKNVTIKIVKLLDRLEQLADEQLNATETLVAEERIQRRKMEKSMKFFAKQNYQMEKQMVHTSREAKIVRRLTGEQSVGGSTPLLSAAAANAASVSGVGTNVMIVDHHIFDRSEVPMSHDNAQGTATPAATAAGVSSAGAKTAWPLPNKGGTSRMYAAGEMESDEDDEADISDGSDSLEFFDVEEEGGAFSPRGSGSAPNKFKRVEERIRPAEDAAAGEPTSETGDVERRKKLPKPRTDFKIRLWSLLKGCIGKDLSRISFPVYFNEPTSLLQRFVEDCQYTWLLKKASAMPTSVERLLWVSIFAISPYASAVGRTYKPFNPLLGETAELSHRGFKFLAEQVGHHPPVSAYYCEADEFVTWGSMMVANRFTGKSLEVTMPGTAHIFLPHTRDKDHYTFGRSKVLVNNIIFGRLMLEMFGIVTVVNHITGDYAVIEFQRRGWWDTDYHKVRGLVFDRTGRAVYRIGGNWFREIWVEDCIDTYGTSTSVPPARPPPSPIASPYSSAQLTGSAPPALVIPTPPPPLVSPLIAEQSPVRGPLYPSSIDSGSPSTTGPEVGFSAALSSADAAAPHAVPPPPPLADGAVAFAADDARPCMGTKQEAVDDETTVSLPHSPLVSRSTGVNAPQISGSIPADSPVSSVSAPSRPDREDTKFNPVGNLQSQTSAEWGPTPKNNVPLKDLPSVGKMLNFVNKCAPLEGEADAMSRPRVDLCRGLRCLAKTPPAIASEFTINWDSYETDKDSRRVFWRPDPRPPHSSQYYEFGWLTFELNELSRDYDPKQGAVMPLTDSRFRPDLRAYELGDVECANSEKNRLEDEQRARARDRKNGEDDYSPRWFFRGKNSVTGEACWLYNGEYWEQKAAGSFVDSPQIF